MINESIIMTNTNIQFNSEIWQEGDKFVAYAPQLDISSCGETVERARANLTEAIELFFEEAEKLGTLGSILKESGFIFDHFWQAPEIIAYEKMKLAI
ncbi:MAG: hypothetical protein WC517_01600 [Patescibacteria group bacterium]